MNILILGSGGREHTLAWKLHQSPKLRQLFVAPGNAGTATIAKNIPIGVNDFQSIRELVLSEAINMVIVGPEDPLVNGVHDFFLNDEKLKNVPVIGPQKAAAELEGSKEFAKKFMMRHAIPTAGYQSFTAADLEEGYAFLDTLNAPYVLKADGLAAGKGVLILQDLNEAKEELRTMLIDEKFGDVATGERIIGFGENEDIARCLSHRVLQFFAIELHASWAFDDADFVLGDDLFNGIVVG